ncbi:MAG: phosphoenolpyruvate--protein phosphotransferase [Brevinema sp.]
MIKLYGIPIGYGIRIGSVLIKSDPNQDLCFTGITADQVANEMEKYQSALSELTADIDQMKSNTTSNIISKQMIDLYHSIVQDPFFKTTILNHIKEQTISAQQALHDKLKFMEAEFAKIPNEYLKTRFIDFKSIGNQLMHKLDGIKLDQITEPIILVAKELSAAELLGLNMNNILAVVLEKGGGSTSHSAILLNSMEIPAIFGVENLLKMLKNNDKIIVDAHQGKIITHPSDALVSYYEVLHQKYREYHKTLCQTASRPSVTKDGVTLSIMTNAGNIEDVKIACRHQADAVGLLRTEIFSMTCNQLAHDDKTMNHYCCMMAELPNKSFTVRTIDLGGDKFLSFENSDTVEANPYLGYRSTRYFLDNPTILKDQIRMLIKLHDQNPHIKIMFPFVSTVEDIIELKKIYMECWHETHEEPNTIPIGMMAEVPSVFICIEDFLPHVDFISIGTNDLTQYVLATDRGNPHVSDYFQMGNPAVLKLIYHAIKECAKANIPLSMCGELAREPIYARLLLGMGLREFSMSPKSIPLIKYILINSDTKECQNLWEQVKHKSQEREITDLLKEDLGKFLYAQNMYFDREFVNQ